MRYGVAYWGRCHWLKLNLNDKVFYELSCLHPAQNIGHLSTEFVSNLHQPARRLSVVLALVLLAVAVVLEVDSMAVLHTINVG